MDMPDSDELDDDGGPAVVDVDEVNGEVLPISFRRRDIVDSVQRNRVTIIVAETGSGKSSQVVRSVGTGRLSLLSDSHTVTYLTLGTWLRMLTPAGPTWPAPSPGR